MTITDINLILLTAASLLALFVAAVVARALLRDRTLRDRTGLLLLVYILLAAVWIVGQLVLFVAQSGLLPGELLARLLLYALIPLSVLFLELTYRFLRRGKGNWLWWLVGLVWLAAVVILGEGLLDLLGAGDLASVLTGLDLGGQDLAFGLLVLGWVVFAGAATVLTIRAYRRIRQPLHRNRITYWAMALVFAIAGAALFLAGYSGHGGALAYVLAIASVAYLMITYHLPDVRLTGRRLLSYLLTTLFVIVVYTAAFVATYSVLQNVPGYDPWLVGVMMALVLAIVLHPLLNRANKAMNRALLGSDYDPSRTLREYSTSISNILGLDRLTTVAVGLISEAMEIRMGGLFVVRREVDEDAVGAAAKPGEQNRFHLRGVTGMGEDQPPGWLSPESPVVQHIRQERRPLMQYDIDILPRFRGTPPEERAWLSSLDMDVYVPIYAKGAWIGLLALGPKESGDRYYEEDLDLLSTLADQTAVALQNARLFEDLKVRNAENERLNEELTTANRELIRLDKAKSDFILIASHEIKTPLTTVKGYNDLLSQLIETDALTPERGRQMLSAIRGSVQRLEEVANTLVDVSRIETETLTLKVWPTPVEQIVESAAERWAVAMRERRLDFSTRGLHDLPTVVADGQRLEQVLSELIQNAIKFTPNGGKIQVRGRLRDPDLEIQDQTIELVVADTGIGIETNDLSRVFEKFYRAGDVMLHSTGKTKFKGAGPGLGLTLARGIVEAHGGFIWAESPGHDEKACPGSEFHVVLPVRPQHLQASGVEL